MTEQGVPASQLFSVLAPTGLGWNPASDITGETWPRDLTSLSFSSTIHKARV